MKLGTVCLCVQQVVLMALFNEVDGLWQVNKQGVMRVTVDGDLLITVTSAEAWESNPGISADLFVLLYRSPKPVCFIYLI